MELLKSIQSKKSKDKDEANLSGEFGKSKIDKEKDKKKLTGHILLPERLKHPPSNDVFYPVYSDNIIYDCFNLKVIYDRERTGFEETKEFPIVIN